MTAENAWYAHSGGRTFYFSLDYNGYIFWRKQVGQFVVTSDHIKQLKTLFLTPRPQSIKSIDT